MRPATHRESKLKAFLPLVDARNGEVPVATGKHMKRHLPDPNHAGRALCGRRLPAYAPWSQRRGLPVCRKCVQQRRRAASGQIRQQTSKGRPGRQRSLFELIPNEPEFFS